MPSSGSRLTEPSPGRACGSAPLLRLGAPSSSLHRRRQWRRRAPHPALLDGARCPLPRRPEPQKRRRRRRTACKQTPAPALRLTAPWWLTAARVSQTTSPPTLSAASCRSLTTRCRAPPARQSSQRGRLRRAAVQHAWRITRNPAPLAGRHCQCLQCVGGAGGLCASTACVAWALAVQLSSPSRRRLLCAHAYGGCHAATAPGSRPMCGHWRWRAHELRSVAAAAAAVALALVAAVRRLS
jgi:hypothetical protein